MSYAWIFPNVIVNGHWWYSNIPAYITHDCRARLQAVPKTKLIGYYSDAYKLEFVLPKYNMYRRILAQILADDFVRPGLLTKSQAVDLASCCCATTASASSAFRSSQLEYKRRKVTVLRTLGIFSAAVLP